MPEIRTINVPWWSITSQKPFETVVAAVEAAIGRPDMATFAQEIADSPTFEEMQEAVQRDVSEVGLMLFMRLDAGAVLGKSGVNSNPKRVCLIVGNPLIMQSMARLVSDAVSYAAVTVLIDQRPDGVHLSHDEMTSFLDSYGNVEALAIARDLDAKVERMLLESSYR